MKEPHDAGCWEDVPSKGPPTPSTATPTLGAPPHWIRTIAMPLYMPDHLYMKAFTLQIGAAYVLLDKALTSCTCVGSGAF